MSAGPNDLTDLNTLKTTLRVTHSNDDALLQILITNVSDFIQKWLNRTFAVTNYTDIIDGQGYGAQKIILANTPIVSVTSVTICGVVLNNVAITDNKTPGYRYDSNYIYLNCYCLTKGIANVQVSYSSGYTTTPYSVQQACNELVALAYKEISRVGEASKVVSGETVAYITKDMQARVATTLGNWKKVIPVGV